MKFYVSLCTFEAILLVWKNILQFITTQKSGDQKPAFFSKALSNWDRFFNTFA